jgi:putative membrane protein
MKLLLKPQKGIVGLLARVLPKLSWLKLCLGLWIFSMIPTPLFPDYFLPLSYFSTLLLSVTVLGYALENYGSKAYLLFVLAFVFGVVVEWLGKTTGFPFGNYFYAEQGPMIFGVPTIVPLGWWAFTMIALSVPSAYKYWLAPLALVAWDVGLDPLMVQQGFWNFSPAGFYFGIPLSNFFGWYIAGFILLRLMIGLEPRLLQDTSPTLRFTFAVQAFFIGVGLSIFYAMPLAGLCAMGLMGLCLVVMSRLE